MNTDLEKINREIEKSVIEYGEVNIKRTYLHHLKLIATWKTFGKSVALEETVDQLFQSLFVRNGLVKQNIKTEYSDNTYSIQEKDFYKMYSKDDLKILGRIDGEKYDFSRLKGIIHGFNKYPYIITPSDKFRVYCKPQSMRRTLLGLLDESFYPSHAHISSVYDFKVKCAGEISVIWPSENVCPDIIVLNNLSGHFLPKEVNCNWLFDFAKQYIGYCSETCIITITNNGYKFC